VSSILPVLSWQKDPLLFDVHPKESNQWLNANELLESGRKKEVFIADGEILNLYPIMIRRNDFLRRKASDRVLARFPFLRLTAEEREVFERYELLIAERLRNYFYFSIDRRILEWRSLLRHYLKERGAVPLPFLRCLPSPSSPPLRDRLFESARGELFTLPSTLTPELAYLCGVINGDGSLSKYILNIVDFSLTNIQQLQERFTRLFKLHGRIQQQMENCPTLIITNLWVVRLFSFLTGQPISGKKYATLREPLLYRGNASLRSAYWSGVMDTDGSYTQNRVILASASEKFAQDFVQFLLDQNIQSSFKKRGDNTYQVYIPRKYHQNYKDNMLCYHPEKVKDFLKLREGKTKNPTQPRVFVDFKKEAIVHGYFNFHLLKEVQITGLGSYLRFSRGNATLVSFAKKLGITPSFLQQLELGKSAIAIEILSKLLEIKNESLRSFLPKHASTIRFRKYKSIPVRLDLQPSATLRRIIKQMVFYQKAILIKSTDPSFLAKIQKHFAVQLTGKYLKNSTIRYFLTTFCNLRVLSEGSKAGF